MRTNTLVLSRLEVQWQFLKLNHKLVRGLITFFYRWEDACNDMI